MSSSHFPFIMPIQKSILCGPDHQGSKQDRMLQKHNILFTRQTIWTFHEHFKQLAVVKEPNYINIGGASPGVLRAKFHRRPLFDWEGNPIEQTSRQSFTEEIIDGFEVGQDVADYIDQLIPTVQS